MLGTATLAPPDLPVAGVTVVRQPANLGMVGNWNYCLTAGTNDWVCLVHDDDRLLDGAAEAIRRACALVGGSGVVAHAENLRLRHVADGGFCYERREPGAFAVLDTAVCPSGVTIHRAVVAAAGGFSDAFAYSADLEYFARLFARFPSVVIRNPRVLEYVLHGGNYQFKTWRRDDFLAQLRAVEAAALAHAGLPAGEHAAMLRERLDRDMLYMVRASTAAGERTLARTVAGAMLRASAPSNKHRLGLWTARLLGRSPKVLLS